MLAILYGAEGLQIAIYGYLQVALVAGLCD